MSKIIKLAPKRPIRMSSKLREAVRLTVVAGLSITDACKESGLSRAGYHKALKRPEVRDYLSEVQREFIQDAEAKRAFLKVRAFEVALELLNTSKNESIRARMVEFLAADAKVSPVAVHIDARQAAPGYEYVRPGARVVEVSDVIPHGEGGE